MFFIENTFLVWILILPTHLYGMGLYDHMEGATLDDDELLQNFTYEGPGCNQFQDILSPAYQPNIYEHQIVYNECEHIPMSPSETYNTFGLPHEAHKISFKMFEEGKYGVDSDQFFEPRIDDHIVFSQEPNSNEPRPLDTSFNGECVESSLRGEYKHIPVSLSETMDTWGSSNVNHNLACNILNKDIYDGHLSQFLEPNIDDCVLCKEGPNANQERALVPLFRGRSIDDIQSGHFPHNLEGSKQFKFSGSSLSRESVKDTKTPDFLGSISRSVCEKDDQRESCGMLSPPQHKYQGLQNGMKESDCRSTFSYHQEDCYKPLRTSPLFTPTEDLYNFLYDDVTTNKNGDLCHTVIKPDIIEDTINNSREQAVDSYTKKINVQIMHVTEDHSKKRSEPGIQEQPSNPDKRRFQTINVNTDVKMCTFGTPLVKNIEHKQKQFGANDSSREASDGKSQGESLRPLSSNHQEIISLRSVDPKAIMAEKDLRMQEHLPKPYGNFRIQMMNSQLKARGEAISIIFGIESKKKEFFGALQCSLNLSGVDFTKSQKNQIAGAVRCTRLHLLPKFLGALKLIYEHQTNCVSFKRKPTLEDEIERGWEIFTKILKRWGNLNIQENIGWLSKPQKRLPVNNEYQSYHLGDSSVYKRQKTDNAPIFNRLNKMDAIDKFPSIHNHEKFDWLDPSTSLRYYLSIKLHDKPSEVYLWYLLKEWHSLVKGRDHKSFQAFMYREKIFECYPDYRPSSHRTIPSFQKDCT